MSATIPEGVENAKTPNEIAEATDRLREFDAPQAIEPLAQLSRRAPGWLVIQSGLIVTTTIELVGLAVATGLVTIEVWLISTIVNWFLRTFYPDWVGLWWSIWALMVALWLWRDTRLRGLLGDARFALPRDEFTWVWLILLWPLRVFAGALRLCVALGFLSLMLAPTLTGLIFIVSVSADRQVRGLLNQEDLLGYGVVAGAILVLFSLFILSDWPRHVLPILRQESFKQKLKRLLLAFLIAVGLGLFVRGVSPVNGDVNGLTAGVVFFPLFGWFLRVRAASHPFQLDWVKHLTVSFTERQSRFLKLTLFLLGLLGTGAVIVTVADSWGSIRPFVPETWLKELREWFQHNMDARIGVYNIVEPWIVGLIVGGILSGFQLVYLTGWGIRVAQPFAWPFFSLRRSAHDLMARLRARLAISRAVQFHRERNLRLIGRRGELAICREHLARFESLQARLAYGRRWEYWWCRVCHSDTQAFTGVRVMRGVFDQDMTEKVLQNGDTLLVNLLPQSDGKTAPMPLDLQEVYVGTVKDLHDVEKFIVNYQNARPPVTAPKLKQIKLRIDRDAHLDENVERMLIQSFHT